MRGDEWRAILADDKVGDTKASASPRRLRKTKSRGGGSRSSPRRSTDRGGARHGVGVGVGGMKNIVEELHDLGDRLTRLVPPKFNVPVRDSGRDRGATRPRDDYLHLERFESLGALVNNCLLVKCNFISCLSTKLFRLPIFLCVRVRSRGDLCSRRGKRRRRRGRMSPASCGHWPWASAAKNTTLASSNSSERDTTRKRKREISPPSSRRARRSSSR